MLAPLRGRQEESIRCSARYIGFVRSPLISNISAFRTHGCRQCLANPQRSADGYAGYTFYNRIRRITCNFVGVVACALHGYRDPFASLPGRQDETLRRSALYDAAIRSPLIIHGSAGRNHGCRQRIAHHRRSAHLRRSTDGYTGYTLYDLRRLITCNFVDVVAGSRHGYRDLFASLLGRRDESLCRSVLLYGDAIRFP